MALRFCKEQYRTSLYSTHFNIVDVFSLDRTTVSSLKTKALNAHKKAYLGHTLQTLKNSSFARTTVSSLKTKALNAHK